MKTKKISKKLVLNKSTITNLSHGEMTGLKGGVFTEHTCTCETFCTCIHMTCGATLRYTNCFECPPW